MRLKSSVLLLILLLLTACSLAGKPTPTPAGPTSTLLPTLTATPVIQPLVILLLPADMPQADYDRYQTMFYNLAQAAGMRFQVRNALTPADVAFEGPALKVVIALPPDPGLADLVAAAPSVQFLAVNIPGLPAAPNLSTIGSTGVPLDQQAFLAGYIAGLVAPEWKVGLLYQKDTPAGDTVKAAFTNGFIFYCGSCRSPNFTQPSGIFPIDVGIPTDAKPGEYPAYSDLLWHNAVKAVYVMPALASRDLVNYMAEKDLMMIGQTLPDDGIRSHWVASLQPDMDSAIQKIFPELVAGKGGQNRPTPLFLTDVNSSLLTEGKLRLAQQVLAGLQDGSISTGVTP